jgi:predicted enzyme related to lactoylglutathione lyase
VNFNSILIGSEESERLAEYYGRVLGEPAFTGEGYTTWMIGSGAVTVGPHTEVKGRNTAPGRLIWNIESADVRADFDRFQAAGATVVKAPYEFEGMPGTWIATFSDPDDNYFQLISPVTM